MTGCGGGLIGCGGGGSGCGGGGSGWGGLGVDGCVERFNTIMVIAITVPKKINSSKTVNAVAALFIELFAKRCRLASLLHQPIFYSLSKAKSDNEM